MEGVDVGWLSLLPPLLAVGLALCTKEVFSSLIIGILSGVLVYTIKTDGNVFIDTLQTTINVMESKFEFKIVLFCSLLGALVYIIYMAGASKAYGEWASSKFKSRRSALLGTASLGSLIFIDDYFSCLTVGTVMSPITDKHKVSRAKLAYIVDAIAAPVCILVPISSWAAAVGSNLKATNAFESEFMALLQTIPWNFYALLSIALVYAVCYFDINLGAMKKVENEVLQNQEIEKTKLSSSNAHGVSIKGNGTMWDMLLPLLGLVIVVPIVMLYTGGYWSGSEERHSIGAAIGNCDSATSLVFGGVFSLLVAFLLLVPRKILSVSDYMIGFVHGVKAMVPAVLILTFAWTISSVTRDLLHAPSFIATLVPNESSLLTSILPSMIFVIAGFLSFSIGSAWGTFGILIPIVAMTAQVIAPEAPIFVIICLSATLAGSVFGDHCSPISDTTVLSAAGAGCLHIEHVYTQFPYAILAAISSIVGYLVAGFTYNVYISLVSALFTLGIVVFFYNRFRKEQLK